MRQAQADLHYEQVTMAGSLQNGKYPSTRKGRQDQTARQGVFKALPGNHHRGEDGDRPGQEPASAPSGKRPRASPCPKTTSIAAIRKPWRARAEDYEEIAMKLRPNGVAVIVMR